jgi:hypothetical protein
MRTKIAAMTAALMVAMTAVASATPVLSSTDYDGVKTGVTSELGGAAAPAFVLLGIIAGVLIAVRLFKKISGART